MPILLLLFSIIPVLSSGQSYDKKIGDWRSHLSYENCIDIAESSDFVYFASAQAIIKVHKTEGYIYHINKVSGMSDMGIRSIHFNKENDMLIVGYNNGNIDLRFSNGYVQNLSAILNNSNIIGEKSINHIFTRGQKIYFSCSFGLVVYDLEIDAFSQTTFTTTQVNNCNILNDTIFISTNDGIYAGVMDGRNLLDFNLWILQNNAHGLPFSSAYNSKNLILFDNKIYADANDTLFIYQNGTWNHFSGLFTKDTTYFNSWSPVRPGDYIANYQFDLSSDGNKLLISTYTPYFYSITKDSTVSENYYSGVWRSIGVIQDQYGKFWAADLGGMHKNYQKIKHNAPYRNIVSDLHVDEDGTLWVTSSKFSPAHPDYFSGNGFFKFESGNWTTYNKNTVPEMDTFWDCFRAITNPDNNKVYIASSMSGLLELDENENVQLYDRYTPDIPLEGADGNEARTKITGLAVDEDGNVWMTNSKSYNAILTVKKLNGEWQSFPSSYFSSYAVEDIVIDRNDYKWIKQVTGKITVFDSGRLNDDNDNRSIQLGASNTVMPNDNVLSLASDKDGVIWVGTTEGIVIFNCSSNLFDGSCQGNRPIISVDNFNGYLLEGEQIQDIEVDGANRKWIATKNGVFLLSEDGYDQLAYFNKDNSPLFDNDVSKIAFDGQSGYVYFASTVGLQSYRSESTQGLRKMNAEDIIVFPHPVEPDYDGPIAISNLADDANVKITDISGRLVYETQALGGQAIWYGTDYNGRKAQSGVYLVYIVNESGGQQAVGKILFLN